MNATAAPKRSLFEIDEGRRSIIAAIEAADGEITPAQEAELQALDEALLCAVDRYGWTIDRLTREAEAFRSRAAVLAMYAQVREKQVERLKDRMAQALIAQGQQTVGGADWTVALRASERCVVECAPSALPDVFQRVEVVADRAALKKALKAGASVPGVRLEKAPYIVIK